MWGGAPRSLRSTSLRLRLRLRLRQVDAVAVALLPDRLAQGPPQAAVRGRLLEAGGRRSLIKHC